MNTPFGVYTLKIFPQEGLELYIEMYETSSNASTSWVSASSSFILRPNNTWDSISQENDAEFYFYLGQHWNEFLQIISEYRLKASL